MTTGLNQKYFVSLALEDYLNDPTSGLPLAGGYIECFADDQRATPKICYQLSGNPPNYTYEPLPNPIPLSANGMPMNANGDIVRIYYYPFDEQNNLQLYYLVVKNSDDVTVYEIPAIPNLADSENPELTSNVYENQLSNSQFVEVSFNPQIGMSINIPGTVTNQVYDIAPDWQVMVSTNGASNLIINQVALEGSLAVPTNPPYVMQIQSSGSTTSLQLIQQLSNNPDIWSSTTAGTGFLAGFMLVSSLDGLPHTVSMYYAPSVAPSPQLIVTGSTGISGYKQLSATVELTAGTNSQDGNSGYVNIIVDLPVNVNMYISSLQIVGLPDEVNVSYSQETSNRQRDHLFNYYEQPLKFKPISSYLVGWDFPLNPAQFGSSGTLGALGANTSAYIWDQTIAFQSTTNSISYQRAAQGLRSGLQIATTANTQFALIQYVPLNELAEIINNNLSVNVNMASTPGTANATGTVSLWYCTDDTLPDLSTNDSIVATLGTNGSVASTNGAWVEIPTVNGIDATFILPGSGNGFFFNFPLSYFTNISSSFADANFFAIVVGFSEIPASNTLYFESVSLVPGQIATPPAPQSQDEVLRECQYYYEKSYPTGVNPGSSGGGGELLFPMITSDAGGDQSLYAQDININFTVEKYAQPDVSVWPPSLATITEGNVTIQMITGGTFPTAASGPNPTNITLLDEYTLYSLSTKSVLYRAAATSQLMQITVSAVPSMQSQMILQYVAAARLGLESGV